MALTKSDIMGSVQNQLDLSHKQSSDLVESLLEIIKQTLESGDNVMISGFGKLSVKEKAKRRGRNPATGHDLMLDARRVVTFKCSGKLRDRMNGNTNPKR